MEAEGQEAKGAERAAEEAREEPWPGLPLILRRCCCERSVVRRLGHLLLYFYSCQRIPVGVGAVRPGSPSSLSRVGFFQSG